MKTSINTWTKTGRLTCAIQTKTRLHVSLASVSQSCDRVFAQELVLPAAGIKQTSDPLGALVPVVLAGATCVVAKLFHKQHKQQKDLKHKQGMP